ncbi:hypothetical protein [Terasakiella sp. SH-1]|uniref:hypothetical protein n=1 Tax=Terasakiella sp. SH-1 TaxID=2560057 RepID=UPI0010740FE8|nr:hypothetical protein [Terasakiella sp. SH-1]
MKTIDEYIDKAKELNSFQSDRELGRALGFKGNPVNNWRTKRTWPAEGTMIELANLADVHPEIALLDLGIWRSEGQASVVYTHMKELLETMPNKLMSLLAFAAFLPLFNPSPLTRRDI